MIGGMAATDGIALVELTVQVTSLEDAFIQLTRDETDYHAELTGATAEA